MFAFFEGILGFITTIVNFVISAFEMLMVVVTQIPVAIAFIATGVTYLPPYLTAFVMLFVGTCVVFNLINKGD